jgi:hypothetical protein
MFDLRNYPTGISAESPNPNVRAMLLGLMIRNGEDMNRRELVAFRTWQSYEKSTKALTMQHLEKLGDADCPANPAGLSWYLESGCNGAKLKQSYVQSMIGTLGRVAKILYVEFNKLEWNMMKLAARRYAAANPEPQMERGSITLEQFEQLCAVIIEEKSDIMDVQLDGLILHYAFAYRGAQVRTLTRNQFKKVDGNHWIYVGPRHKDKKQPGNVERVEQHECMPALRDDVAEIMKKYDGLGDQCMLPTYNINRLRTTVKATAETNNWDPDLNWVVHGLRHGSIGQAYVAGGIVGALRRSGQLAAASGKLYARSNTQRKAEATGVRKVSKPGRPAATPRTLAIAVKNAESARAAAKRVAEKSAKSAKSNSRKPGKTKPGAKAPSGGGAGTKPKKR